ncbi:MAG: DUF1573 domain-containing protein [Phycisphaerales bacterium]|nr:MAG: DUF1573 domain-containing protein [Phycisphaerales bacterium]
MGRVQFSGRSDTLFEQVACDLGQVGVGTGNLCEFGFGNAADTMLKVTSVKATCGCTVVQLDKREYAAGGAYFSDVLHVGVKGGEGGDLRGAKIKRI